MSEEEKKEMIELITPQKTDKDYEEEIKDVLGAFLLVNNPIVLSEEEIKDVQKAIKQLQQENKQLKKELHALEISEEQWLEETLGSDKE